VLGTGTVKFGSESAISPAYALTIDRWERNISGVMTLGTVSTTASGAFAGAHARKVIDLQQISARLNSSDFLL
jgi:hypothetical protein